MYYFKQTNEDNSITYLMFSFSPIVTDNMEQITEEEYISVTTPIEEESYGSIKI